MPSPNHSPEMVEQQVKQIVMTSLGVEAGQVTREATLDDLGADSLDKINIVMALEDSFDMEIPDEEATARQTVPAIVEFILTQKGT